MAQIETMETVQSNTFEHVTNKNVFAGKCFGCQNTAKYSLINFSFMIFIFFYHHILSYVRIKRKNCENVVNLGEKTSYNMFGFTKKKKCF